MSTEYNAYGYPLPSNQTSLAQPDLATLLELYFNPKLSPFDIARRLNLSLDQLIEFTHREDFQRLVDNLKTLMEARARHLAAAASHHAIQAVTEGVQSLQHELAQASDNAAASEPDSSSLPVADSSSHASPPTNPSRRLSQNQDPGKKPIDRRRALDSLVRALDKLTKAATATPPRLRLAS